MGASSDRAELFTLRTQVEEITARVLALASQTIAIPAAGQTNPMFSGSMTVIRPSRQAPTYAVSHALSGLIRAHSNVVRARVLTGSVLWRCPPAGSRDRRN